MVVYSSEDEYKTYSNTDKTPRPRAEASADADVQQALAVKCAMWKTVTTCYWWEK